MATLPPGLRFVEHTAADFNVIGGGTLAPQALPEGGTAGFDHKRPAVTRIEQADGSELILDMACLGKNPGKVAEIVRRQRAQHADSSDAILAAFAEIAALPESPAPATKAAANGADPAFAARPFPTAYGQPPGLEHAQREAKREAEAAAPQQVIRDLRAELQVVRESAQRAPLRKVVFDLPVPGNLEASMGQVTAYFHDIIVHDGILALVYDHRHPTQSVYFPPNLVDPRNPNQPLALAALVAGAENATEKLYLVYPLLRFPYKGLEFCFLSIEREKGQG